MHGLDDCEHPVVLMRLMPSYCQSTKGIKSAIEATCHAWCVRATEVAAHRHTLEQADVEADFLRRKGEGMESVRT